MRKLILGVASVSAAAFAAAPAAEALSSSRFCPKELDPTPGSDHEPQQSD